MSLRPGTHFGSYEILSPLGVGGMGEVYRAKDTRLRRDVALKILPDLFANDAQRMARFDREAQVLAALNHPNIAGIFGLEESGGTRALVMELVEGLTLAERIARSALPLEEALPVAKQLAEALEYAHERAIVHRDLKPANLKVKEDGTVKVLDFGIAKALADDPGTADINNSPTLTAEATRAGIILGTAGYMSPEQARGRPLDRRTDIWSYGCVLFEMLTAKPAFARESATDTLAAVLTTEPDWRRLPVTTPPGIRRLLERCLQKDVKKRLQAIGDARIEIDDLLTGKDMGEVATSLGREVRKKDRENSKRFAARLAIAAGIIVALAVGLTAWWVQGRRANAAEWTADMIPGPNVALGPRISPDGHILAFQAMIDKLTQVAVASPEAGNWTLLTHDRRHGFVNEISWSPDGTKLYYDRTTATPVGVYSVPALGGEERLVLENAGTPEALPDGSLLVIHSEPNGSWRIEHYWPESQRLEPLPGWVSISTTIPLRVFPDGKDAVFYGTVKDTETEQQLYLMEIATGKTRRLGVELPQRTYNEGYPIATTPDGSEVLLDIPAGELHRIVAVPRSGSSNIQTAVTLTSPPWYLDAGKDGSLYMDLMDRPHEIVRFSMSGGTPEILGHSDTFVPAGQYMEPVETTSGRYLLATKFSGRGRMLVGKPGADFLPLLDTNEETSSPSTALRNNEVALVVGSGPDAQVAIVSVTDGRIIRRLQGTKGRHVGSLAASPDAETIYFGADGYIWRIPATDGTPEKIAEGDAVTVNPNGNEVVLTQRQTTGPLLVRVPTAGGKPEKIRTQNGVSLAPVPTGARAMNKDGKILISISPSDSWFYRVAVLDPVTGQITPVNVNYTGDTISANWTPDGQVVAVGLPLKGHVWRFRRRAE